MNWNSYSHVTYTVLFPIPTPTALSTLEPCSGDKEPDLDVSASSYSPHCHRNSHRDLLPLQKPRDLGGGGRAGEGDLSGLPLRARLVELGLAWVGKGKARVLLGVDLKWERTDPTSLRPWPTDLRGSQADRTLGLGPRSRQVQQT